MLNDLRDGISYLDIRGPFRDNKKGVVVGYGSIIKGFVSIGDGTKIGNGSYIISENSIVRIGRNCEIGDCNKIKLRDDANENKGLNIIIGDETITKFGVVLENGILLGKGNYIGDNCIFGRNVVVGDGNRFNQLSNIPKNVKIGNGNIFYACTVGSAPQGQVHEDEGTLLEIGDGNLFREYVVINRGSVRMGKDGKTKIGNNNKIFSQVHIGHDCEIGNDNEIISGTMLGGHVHVGNYARISGMVGIQPFVHIGNYAFVGGMAGVNGNVLPYSRVGGNPAVLKGINFNRLGKISSNPEEVRKIYRELREIYEVITNRDISDSGLVDKLEGLGVGIKNDFIEFICSLNERNKSIIRFRSDGKYDN
ncbi:MAG: hypothetical protein N3D20_02460 [Candidatus Pacearchaeota archaeon]|nr:hypothetical protein [Candidatus Pacearchaeota archaeon]